MRRALSLALFAALATAAALGSWSALAGAANPTKRSRLQGEFRVAGKVTSALHVPGEHRGQHVTRLWVFTPKCSSGACSKVTLVRRRANGRDRLVLRRKAAGYYTGSGRYDIPIRCGGKTYKRGSSVPFVITVRITGATVTGGVPVVTALKASYRSRARANRTPCVKLPQRDAATYRGKLLTLTPAPGAP